MKKCFLLSVGFFLFLITALGQKSIQFTEGVIIKKTGDTLKCFVELSMGYEVDVKYKVEEDDFILTIPTKQVQKITTAYQQYENILVGNREKIMAVTIKGHTNLYKVVVFNDVLGPPGSITVYGKPKVDYIIEKNGVFYEVKEKDFKTTIVQILNDCNKLAQKINENNYKFNELEKVIKDYNDCQKSELQLANEAKLLGKWKSDMSDAMTKNTVGEAEMIYTKDGNIQYDMIEGRDVQRMTLTYRVSGDSIISNQSFLLPEQVTMYKFESNDRLILEINGIRSVFLRKTGK